MVEIRDLYTPTFPLGPAVAPTDLADRERLALLFDPENKLVSQLNHDKSLIIGRKGSGKTTLLGSVQLLETKAEFFYLPASTIFTQIVKEINELSDGVIFVEQVGQLWDFVLWGPVMKMIAEKYGETEIASFCKALQIDEQDNPYEIITTMLSTIKKFPPTEWPLPEKIAFKKIGSVSFLQAKEIATARLKAEKMYAYVLMDSLEDFKLHIPNFSLALAGLLRCVGEFNETPKASVILRCCLPIERYFDYMALSTNPLKDFRAAMLLHWDAGELIHLSAVRYAKYLKEYHSTFFHDHIKSLELKNRAHLRKFWDLIFPDFVTNRINIEERPIAYILRHTQLLPRHFIFLLNEIISRSLKHDQRAYGIDSKHVRLGIFESEERIFEQIIEAYSTPYQDPRAACQSALKELRTIFTWSEFDKVASKTTRLGIPGANNRTELMSLLAEIGAVGRIVGESKRYTEGVFEYMVPHKLVFSERDSFCIHPVFSEVCQVNTAYKGIKPVYTYWSGIIGSGLEEWMM
jgi:hypothetical protein